MKQNRWIWTLVALALGVAPSAADTITFTDLAALNTGAASVRVGAFTLSAQGAAGYLQFTGYGVGHSGSISRDEVDYPDVLIVESDDPIDIASALVGRLEPATPYVDRPGYLPGRELAGFSAVRWDGTTIFPTFVAGEDPSGWATAVLGFTNVRALAFWGLGAVPGIWGEGVHGGALAAFTFARHVAPGPGPTPIPLIPEPGPTPSPETPVPEPEPVPVPTLSPLSALAVGLLSVLARVRSWHRRRDARKRNDERRLGVDSTRAAMRRALGLERAS